MDRRLSAIVAADVVGYSRLMGEDVPMEFASAAWLNATQTGHKSGGSRSH